MFDVAKVAAVAAAGVVAAALAWFSLDSRQEERIDKSADTHETVTSREPQQVSHSVPATQDPEQSLRPEVQGPRPTTVTKPEGSTAVTAVERGKGADEFSTGSVAAAPDFSVVGRPFPVSAAVAGPCSGWDDYCQTTHRAHARFADEPRDPRWAAKQEEALRRFLTDHEPGRWQIRNIECRSTLCFFEVASIHGPWPLRTAFREERSVFSNELFAGWQFFNDESTQADGSHVTVTLVFMTRESGTWRTM